MVKLKNWLLALGAGALAVAALYIKYLEGAATRAELKSLQGKEKELLNEVNKHDMRAVLSFDRAIELRKRLEELSQEQE